MPTPDASIKVRLGDGRPLRASVRRTAVLALAVLAGGCVPLVPSPMAAPTPRAQTGAPSIRLVAAPNVAGDPVTGRRLFFAKGCTACHTVRGMAEASGIAGPNLTNISLRPDFAGGAVANTPQNMLRWVLDPPGMKQGTLMPNLGLTEPEARDVVAFLYSQPLNPIR